MSLPAIRRWLALVATSLMLVMISLALTIYPQAAPAQPASINSTQDLAGNRLIRRLRRLLFQFGLLVLVSFDVLMVMLVNVAAASESAPTPSPVQFDNNRAERLVRSAKVKLKVITVCCALGGSTAFCILRSVWETNNRRAGRDTGAPDTVRQKVKVDRRTDRSGAASNRNSTSPMGSLWPNRSHSLSPTKVGHLKSFEF